MKRSFSEEEKRIINVLYGAQKSLTTKNIAERSEMSWPTAKKYLESLFDKEAVLRGKHDKSVYWWLKS